MKIKLINLPQPNSLDDKLDPPLGLMYLCAFLSKHNFDCEIIDLPFVDRGEWKNRLKGADLYGITVYSASLYLAKEAARIVKENSPRSLVVVGGPHPTSLAQDVLSDEPNFDVVAMGEGELTMLELAQGRPLREIQGIVFRDGEGTRRTKKRALIDDLDTLPLPERKILRVNRYTRKVCGNFATSIISSRGCCFNCAFCCKDVFGYTVRFRSVGSVVEEVRQIIRDYGIRAFLFYDDTFVIKRERLYLLCEELLKFNITFRCNGNAQHNTSEDYKMLYKSGCREIAFGIESGSQEILNRINKGVTVQQNKRAIIDAREAGLLVKAYLMIGNPGESRGTVEQTKQFITEADPDQFTLFTFVPLPGSDIWKHPEKYKIRIIGRDFKEYFNIAGHNEGGLVVETEDLSRDDIRILREELLQFLKLRGQRGALQDYYKKINHE